MCLCSCALVSRNIALVHPNELGMPESLNGRVFSIHCFGNDWADATFVDNKCKEYISEYAYKDGYPLFSVLDKEDASKTSVGTYTTTQPITTYSNATIYSGGYTAYGFGSSTSYVPQTHLYSVTSHAKDYLFVLIDYSEKDKWQNYYKVSDYYRPEENTTK